MSWAKGTTLRSTLDFVAQEAGPERAAEALAQLGEAERAAIEAASATAEVPFELLLELLRAVDAALAPTDPGWVERAGGHSIQSMGSQLYGGILRKASPLEFLTQRVSLFQLFYHPGNMEVVEHEPGRAVLRLRGFDAGDPLFCRRQTGGLLRALQLAGGQGIGAAHVRCALEGDAFCEWELRWS